MSSDPLLTSLCGICHTREPKYKCPRCQAKTCSLACVKKHKNWSACSGERDPTVYVPAAQLRTDSGIDHDYNYLHKLERKVEQVDKMFTEERGILPQRTQDSHPNKRARVNKGQSRGRTTIGEGLRPWARASISRLKKLGINVEQMPFGMSRQKENKTSFNTRNRVINWQVEWLLLEPENSPRRLLSKTFDTVPLFEAFGEGQWQQLSREEKNSEKKEQRARVRDQQAANQTDQQGLVQDLQNLELGTWQNATNLTQDAATGQWNSAPDVMNIHAGVKVDVDEYRFFLGNPKDPARQAKNLVPLSATDNLEAVLRGQTVVEFPQIYVLPAASPLPDGFILKTPKKKEPKTNNKKRKSDALVAYESGSDSDSDSGEEAEPVSKEEGEIRGEDDAEFEFENEEQRRKFLEAYEENAADTTSSSGSDSSDEDMD